jgi:hypothetical protein
MRLLKLALIASVIAGVAPTQALAGFGLKTFEVKFLNQDGTSDTQAGSPPYVMTAGFTLNEATDQRGNPIPAGNPKDIEAFLPAGLVGNPNATPKCTHVAFATSVAARSSCPNNTAVGVVKLTVGSDSGPRTTFNYAVFNLIPPPGVPAEFGFDVLGFFPVVFRPSLRTGEDYGLNTAFNDVLQSLVVYGAQLTLWGVPADPSHDHERGTCEPFVGEPGAESCPGGSSPPRPFLRMPTSCSGPLETTISMDSWQEPFPVGQYVSAPSITRNSLGSPVGIAGCTRLDFSPELQLSPDTTAANAPAGVVTKLHLPQNQDASGLAESDLREAVVPLPVGVSVNPAAADGLTACSELAIGLTNAHKPTCPAASKIGAAEVTTPLLEGPLQGSVYLAEPGVSQGVVQPGRNKFNSLLALYLVVEGSGLLVKLAGKVEANPTTGQLTTRFAETPQLPFDTLTLSFFGGPRAALSTPSTCGAHRTTASLTPWSNEGLALPVASTFQITGECTTGFDPTFTAGTVSNSAANFSPLSVTVSRTDHDRTLGAVAVETPPGLLGMLSKVALCPEPEASRGSCPAASRIGHVTVGAGVGPDPVVLPQQGRQEDPVYLTGPYDGAPFGLTIVDHAEAGPIDLGPVIVRAAVSVDPHTAQVIVRSQSLPQILEGIPLQLRTVNVTLDREGFIFNPTSCEPQTIAATLAASDGTTVPVSNRFQASDCSALTFAPSFSVSTDARHATVRGHGASLLVHLAAREGPSATPTTPAEANIRRVDVQLPIALAARLTTLQMACTESTFSANPASCPAGSNVGFAKAVSPVLTSPLAGPAYLVSHGGKSFPELVVILQGEGITLQLNGETQIKKGTTYSRFETVPDAPIARFELNLPEGPHSALASPKGDLCPAKFGLVMPVTMESQSGAKISKAVKIAKGTCPSVRRGHSHAR